MRYVGDDWTNVSYIEEQMMLDDYRFADPELFPNARLDKIIVDLCFFKDLQTRVDEDRLQIKNSDKKKPEPHNVINASIRFQQSIVNLRAA